MGCRNRYAVLSLKSIAFKFNSKFVVFLYSGKEISLLSTNSAVRCCSFSFSGNLAVYATDKALGHPCEMFIIDVRSPEPVLSPEDNVCRTSMPGSRISALLWGALDETLITGHENGELNIWDGRVNY